MTEPTSGKNRLTFGGDPLFSDSRIRIADHFSTSLCIGENKAFIMQSPAGFFHETRRNGTNSPDFGSDPAYTQIKISLEISDYLWLWQPKFNGSSALGVGGGGGMDSLSLSEHLYSPQVVAEN